MQEKALSTRSAYWDNAKGILIGLVVFSHYLYAYNTRPGVNLASIIVTVIYTFHMPAFIFISGYFSKSENATKSQSIMKLALIYVAFNFLMMIYSHAFEAGKLSLLTAYFSYWYILALIVWRLCVKSLSKVKGIIAISIAVSLLIGFWSEFGNTLALGRIVAFFPFFIIGYKFKMETAASFIKNRKPVVYATGGVLLLLLLFAAYKIIIAFSISESNYLMGSYESAMDLPIRIMLLLIAGAFIIAIGLFIPKRSIPLLSKWGKNSLAIYLLHRVFTLLFAKVFPVSHYHNSYILFALIATVLTMFVFGLESVTVFINKIFGKLTGILCGEQGEQENGRSRKKVLLQSCLAVLFIGVLLIQPAQIVLEKLKWLI